ncbi:carph-isopro domain-containing protein [Paraburkholderia tropica]|uniref:carph-isopro domain-containing protein n=1 Tax=Paraburkholderia tropica TaxID=92647 RepID=UPI001F341966|nr:YdaS family helix-turn-helix protein [Paraburkholderia tropica]
MNTNQTIRIAIYEMGGATMAAEELGVSTSAVYKWIRQGSVPNLKTARRIAEATRIRVSELRPPLNAAN